MKTELPDGFAIRFHHGRRVDGEWGLWFRKGAHKEWGRWDPETTTDGHQTHPAQDISIHGGSTTCELTLNSEKVVYGVADCSVRDRYNKKIGRDISLGRALKRAKHQFPELFPDESAIVQGKE